MKKIEKTEETQLKTTENKISNTNLQQNKSQSKISESKNESRSKTNSLNDSSKSSSSKVGFVENIIRGNRRDSFENLLREEAERIDKINPKKDNFQNINLKEPITGNLYEWNSLFNNSRPIYYYTKGKNINNKTEENKFEDLKSPVVLVDLPDDKIKLFFGKNSLGCNLNISSNKNKKSKNHNVNNNTKNEKKTRPKSAIPNKIFTTPNNFNKNKKNIKTPGKNEGNMVNSKLLTESNLNNTNNNTNDSKINFNHIRPMSIYSNHLPQDTFYFSNTFNDYYKEKLKSFTEKMPILKAKILSKTDKLQKEIKNQNIKSSIKEQQLYDMLLEDNLILKKEDLIIAADRKNPTPLLKSIFKQDNPNSIEIKEHAKLYFNTMKPYGNDDGNVDYTQNDRWRLSKEIPKLRKQYYNFKYGKNKKKEECSTKTNKLIFSYYDENDPQIQILNNLKEDSKKLINNKDIISINEKQIETTNNKNEKETQNSIKSENDSEKSDSIKPKLKKRPLTGINKNSVNQNLNIIKSKTFSRPKSSKLPRPHNDINSSNLQKNNSSLQFSELFKDYMPSNRFPIKTNSNVANVSYGKINQMLHERKLINHTPQDYFMTQTGMYYNLDSLNGTESSTKRNKKRGFKVRPKTADILGRSKINMKKKWDYNGQIKRKNNVNYFCFNDYIDTEFSSRSKVCNKDEKIHHGPMNCFNKMAGKYYSNSNNVNISNKKNKRKEIMENLKGNKFGGLCLDIN